VLTAMTALLLEVCAPVPSPNQASTPSDACIRQSAAKPPSRGHSSTPARPRYWVKPRRTSAKDAVEPADISRHRPARPLNTSMCTGAEQQAYSGQAEKAVTTQEALQHHATLLAELQRAEKDRQRLTQTLAVAEQDVRLQTLNQFVRLEPFQRQRAAPLNVVLVHLSEMDSASQTLRREPFSELSLSRAIGAGFHMRPRVYGHACGVKA
jgi:hypothetical protein